VSIQALATYRPPWDAGDGARRLGPDEDVVTLAVSAARPLVNETVRRVLLVARAPDVPAAVIATALGLEPDTPVEVRLGGGPAALAALAEATPGTLVIAVSPETPAGSAAALAGDGGAEVGGVRAVAGSLPAADDDPRLMRERGTRPAVVAVLNGAAPAAIAGVAAAERGRWGAEPSSVRVGGPAEPLFAIAAGGPVAGVDEPAAAAGGGSVATAEAPVVTSGRIVAVDGASAVAVDVVGEPARLVDVERPAVTPPSGHEAPPGRIPVSLAAHSRAFEAKVGLRAARCACGRLSYPPRSLCLGCGRMDDTEPVPLPRRGAVYTTVTIRTPVPGIAGPYSLAIAALDGVDVRFLVHVTGAPPGSVRIGDAGELVLRRVALRDGTPDYGYAFQPDEVRS
jgi:uncharacterized protein